MMNLHCRSLLVVACLVMAPTYGVAQSTQDIVNQFYPTNRLSTDPEDRQTCFGVHTSLNDEPMVIIAGYTDLDDGVVRVLTRDGAGTFGVGYEVPAKYGITGSNCSVDMVDVDFDGQLEALLTFGAHGGSQGWLFRWNGAQLTNLTPTTIANDRERSELFSPGVIDITHSGWMQILSLGSSEPLAENEPTSNPDEIYEAFSGVYARSRFVLAVGDFDEGSDPRANVFHFRRSQDSVGPFALRVTNGDRKGQHRVATGTITLNGVVVLNASQLTSANAFVDITLSDLPVQNTIIVSMTGDDDSTITVTVWDSTVRVP